MAKGQRDGIRLRNQIAKNRKRAVEVNSLTSNQGKIITGLTGLGAGLSIKTKTLAYTMTGDDDVVLASGTITITLPSVTAKKKRYEIVNIGTGLVTIAVVSGTIDNETTQTLQPLDSITVVSDGTNWWVV